MFAALVRVLDTFPANEAHRAEYLADFQAMAEALRAVQRTDGFWNVSLLRPDPLRRKRADRHGAVHLRDGVGRAHGHACPPADYGPCDRARLDRDGVGAFTTNGFLGCVQGTGKQPSDGQPVTFDSVPDFEDFGLGCFLLGGSGIARLASP